MDATQQEILERLNASGKGTVLEALDISVVEATKEKVVASMPISSKHLQLVGYLHGGVSVVLAETVASLASVMNIDTARQMAFGLEINANHLRPKRDGQLFAVATPIHMGRTTHVWDVRISDEKEKLICISRCTVAVVDRPPDDGDPLFKK
ncbi:hotdog fold thioesterase [Dictyobacter kobayashii]|uniref:Esterase n=1 Tax=Dictyobacter kobayashii TaxID=2014872 RepID=A0A402AG86_9CHLR|nr:hotdog fold thioesterase [Dictyobacter kobayashii]GCE18127.1 esterase [Dictyobacter kobayashii]